MGELIYAVRGSFGLLLNRGVIHPKPIASVKLDPETSICRSIKFSNNGQYLCYCDSRRTVVIETATGHELMSEELSKTKQISFSPQDNIMVTYEPYMVYGSRVNEDGSIKVPKPNLRVWSLKRRKVLETFVVEKREFWRAQFTADESKIIRLSEHGLITYENYCFNDVKLVPVEGVEAFEVSPGDYPHLICFIPASNGQPATLQLLSIVEDFSMKYSMTSFDCEKCTMAWNSKGNYVLVTASVDVDITDNSYFGFSYVYCISVDPSCFQVPLERSGPVHCVEWASNGFEFCVCYGYMPSKVTIFNVNGETVWLVDEGYFNEIYYNPFGNVLVTCGFGNISSGKMVFWNVSQRTKIIEHEAPMTTQFEWAPDGKHFLTATTAPRLRTSNGYRIWDYTKGILCYTTRQTEFWQVVWCPSKSYWSVDIPLLTRKEQAIAFTRNRFITGGQRRGPLDNLPAGAITKSGVYVPPHLRDDYANDVNAIGVTVWEKEQAMKRQQRLFGQHPRWFQPQSFKQRLHSVVQCPQPQRQQPQLERRPKFSPQSFQLPAQSLSSRVSQQRPFRSTLSEQQLKSTTRWKFFRNPASTDDMNDSNENNNNAPDYA